MMWSAPTMHQLQLVMTIHIAGSTTSIIILSIKIAADTPTVITKAQMISRHNSADDNNKSKLLLPCFRLCITTHLVHRKPGEIIVLHHAPDMPLQPVVIVLVLWMDPRER